MTAYANILENLGWAVVHSLWQGVLVLLVVLAVRRLAGPGRPHTAYLAGIAGLVATFAAFLATLAVLIGRDAGAAGETLTLTLSGLATTDGAANAAPMAGFDWMGTIPFLGLFWAVGFFALSLQCMYAWAKTRCYATLGLSAPEGDWGVRFARLVERSDVAARISLRVSALVDSPVTLGTLKPVVLVPAGFLTGLPAAQVEAVLLHEIAHIRRHDFVVGLVQTAIRTTLYFNPAVLLMSRLVNEDREQACDDFAVKTSGNATDLAKGLAALRLSLAPSMAMAASDTKSGPLVTRMERILGRPVQARGLDKVSAIAISAVLVGSTVFASTSWAHPHSAYTLEETIVAADAIPPVPPVPPVPAVPEIPVVPLLGDLLGNFGPVASVPPIPPAVPGSDFESRMEAWGESMEDWGESIGESFEDNFEARFGPAFENRMETWGEDFENRMETWAESIEDQGEHLEELDDMSDAELRGLGLSRADVDAAAEAFGMTVAEAVVGSILPGALGEEARTELEAERRNIDAEAVERVAHARQKMERETMERETMDARQDANDARRQARREAARARAEASRAKAEARRAEARARRHAVRGKSEPNTVTLNGRSFQLDDLRVRMTDALREDGLVAPDESSFELERRKGRLYVNGRRQSGEMLARYSDLLDAVGIDSGTELELEMDDDSASLDMKNGSNRTTLNFKN